MDDDEDVGGGNGDGGDDDDDEEEDYAAAMVGGAVAGRVGGWVGQLATVPIQASGRGPLPVLPPLVGATPPQNAT